MNHGLRRRSFRRFTVLGLWLALGCNDDDVGGSGESSTGSTDTTNTAPTTTPTPTTSVADSSTGTLSSSSGDPTSSSGDPTSSSGDPSSSSGDPTSSSGDPSSSSGDPTTGGDAGFCAQACLDVNDCAMGGNPADWNCNAGFCEFVGVAPPCDPLICNDMGLGLYCSEVSGQSVCLIGCLNDTDCNVLLPDFVCSGVDDFGGSFCESLPCGGAPMGAPCTFGTPDQYGVCDGTACVCDDDSQCTAPGLACNN